MMEQLNSATPVVDDLPLLAVTLLKGVIYQDSDPKLWARLLTLQPRVRDYIAVLGLELILDEAEGYAFLRSRGVDDEAEADVAAMPRLVARRPLSLPVSLLLALLRRKLAEADAGGGDTRLVLSREAILELMRVFLPDASNEARLVDQIDSHIKKIVELGFLRRLKASAAAGTGRVDATHDYEVRRILKAFVDAQWLAAFDERLATYREQLTVESTHE